jgi:hypothetical protein
MKKLPLLFMVCLLATLSIAKGKKTAPAPTTSKSCGTFRWDVKTLTDNSGINWFTITPVPTSIHQLIAQPKKNLDLNRDVHTKRFTGPTTNGGESQLTIFDVFVYDIKTTEKDRDYHLLLSSTNNMNGDKMDGEIPSSDCPDLAGHTQQINTFKNARAVADQIITKLHSGQKFVHVKIIGVPFWDALHGSAGASPNGREYTR